ncbi:L-threonylcarbamoyladenylate synthase [Mucilaginibacter sp. L3T2-6]|uniref:L-threonylcarbamoyladenylate synthase n=1 Tax=Mucilaginibacter sp. L3T2-6 TaxID=3062491 RepID=UPI0026764594|nr:L-threonylcarbamoyladenylate synthase [Mucilaginibacter sp. L3T2-6]MDO3641355.1 L-threonylcarbamoyladenylate synthase [Mucilaginibacter sp. L3T2-6]MDV6213884.1 L-threonylcarbamoyladenylate synthase [Mucilaginibacter sp. L3T2-6]
MITEIGNDIHIAAELLRANKLVAIPTETVYGLAGNVFSEAAVKQIFGVKQRPANNPLIVHVHNADILNEIVRSVPAEAKILLNAFTPGPLTLLLPKKNIVPDMVTAGLPDVAVRLPDHNLTLALMAEAGLPLAAPSANPYTYISPTSAMHVLQMLNGKIPYILDGGSCKFGLESTIIGFPKGVPTLYRKGAIPIEEIEDKIGKIKLATSEKVLAPGMHAKHYSPKTKLIVSDDLEQDIQKYSHQKIGVITYNVYSNLLANEHQLLLCRHDDFKTAGANLYGAMHAMDSRDYDIIIVRKFPDTGIGISINDRLSRAKA